MVDRLELSRRVYLPDYIALRGGSRQMLVELGAGQVGNVSERSRLLEQMGGRGNHHQPMWRAELRRSLPIEFERDGGRFVYVTYTLVTSEEASAMRLVEVELDRD